MKIYTPFSSRKIPQQEQFLYEKFLPFPAIKYFLQLLQNGLSNHPFLSIWVPHSGQYFMILPRIEFWQAGHFNFGNKKSAIPTEAMPAKTQKKPKLIISEPEGLENKLPQIIAAQPTKKTTSIGCA